MPELYAQCEIIVRAKYIKKTEYAILHSIDSLSVCVVVAACGSYDLCIFFFLCSISALVAKMYEFFIFLSPHYCFRCAIIRGHFFLLHFSQFESKKRNKVRFSGYKIKVKLLGSRRKFSYIVNLPSKSITLLLLQFSVL